MPDRENIFLIAFIVVAIAFVTVIWSGFLGTFNIACGTSFNRACANSFKTAFNSGCINFFLKEEFS